ncbi:uncharacterized protein TNCV_801251 [Trichonephila clavipes]|nr:uncharacterized protein TNCV_801251 [Trichonephila clavipes]
MVANSAFAKREKSGLPICPEQKDFLFAADFDRKRYGPLLGITGLLSPCTIFMKIFYQKLWLTKTDWDSLIPQQLTEDWLKFQKAFNEINYLTVPRWVILTADITVELHGFADAFSLAYAAAIYCRQKHNGKIKVQLLVSKTKVAPVKQVSIP